MPLFDPPAPSLLDGVIRGIKGHIVECMRSDPRCRNDDRRLYVEILRRSYGVDPDSYTLSDFASYRQKHPGFESIRRARAAIQREALAEFRARFRGRHHGRDPSPHEIASSGDPLLPTEADRIKKRKGCEKQAREHLGYQERLHD